MREERARMPETHGREADGDVRNPEERAGMPETHGVERERSDLSISSDPELQFAVVPHPRLREG